MGQVAAGTLELPRRPITAPGLQHLRVVGLADVEAGPQVDHLGGQVAIDDRLRARVGRLDLYLAGALPQHAGDDGAVSLELVAHRCSFLGSPRGSGPFTFRSAGSG